MANQYFLYIINDLMTSCSALSFVPSTLEGSAAAAIFPHAFLNCFQFFYIFLEWFGGSEMRLEFHMILYNCVM